jgi:UDP-glucose 4-epimerase
MHRKTALITGGSGYLGTHLAKDLHKRNWNVISLDRRVSDCKYIDLQYNFDIRNREVLHKIFETHKVDAVFHLAGLIEVGESFKYPTEFYDVNVGGTCNLLHAMKMHGVENIIYSSSAAVYRTSDDLLTETSQISNNSPYGYTKYCAESAIRDSGIKHIIFRYFNLAGADPDGEMGEVHEPETHLIPRIIQNLNNFHVYGSDYPTPDGSCLRDYVHVSDVASAHVDGANYLISSGESTTLNLGTGVGYSVLEIIAEIEKIAKNKITYSFKDRRSGDPPRLVADITLAERVLNFYPKHDILSILETAYKWHTKK